MTGQATGVPRGNHGLFHRFGIEAVTLEGRTVNNLLERFHQSFSFYLLCSGSRYVSIGLYMPVLGLLAGGFAFTAIGGWMQLINEEGGGQEQRVPAVFPCKLGKVVPAVL